MNKDVFRKLRQMLMEELDLSRELSDKEILDVCEKYKYNHGEMQKYIKIVYHTRNEKYKAAAGKAMRKSEGSGSRDAA